MNTTTRINEDLPPQIADKGDLRLVCSYLNTLCELYEEIREKGRYTDPCVDERIRRWAFSRRPKYTPYRIL